MEKIFSENNIEKTNFRDRWVKFAFGQQGYIKTDNLNLGIVEFNKNRTSESHKHPVEEALYVLSGKGKIKIEENIYNIEKGEFTYIPKEAEHSIITGKDNLKILFIFAGKIVVDY